MGSEMCIRDSTSGGDTGGGDTGGGDTSGGDTGGGDTSGGDTSGDTGSGNTGGGATSSVPIGGEGATGLSPIGTNLVPVTDFTQSTPFVDLMLAARPFPEQTFADIDDVEYDEDGWPIRLNGDRALTILHMSPTQQEAYKGDYVVLYDGVGRLEYESAATCLLYTSPSPRDLSTSRMPSSA